MSLLTKTVTRYLLCFPSPLAPANIVQPCVPCFPLVIRQEIHNNNISQPTIQASKRQLYQTAAAEIHRLYTSSSNNIIIVMYIFKKAEGRRGAYCICSLPRSFVCSHCVFPFHIFYFIQHFYIFATKTRVAIK